MILVFYKNNAILIIIHLIYLFLFVSHNGNEGEWMNAFKEIGVLFVSRDREMKVKIFEKKFMKFYKWFDKCNVTDKKNILID